MTKTLDQYLRDACARGVIDHAIRACVRADGVVEFYIHASGKDSETCDYAIWPASISVDGEAGSLVIAVDKTPRE